MASLEPRAIEALLPHRAPFRFVDAVLSHDAVGGELLLSLAPDDSRLEAERLSPLLLVEALTQSAAAWHALRDGEPERGVLVQIDSAELLASARAGDEVHLELRCTAHYGPLVRFSGTARSGIRALARAAFTVRRGEPRTEVAA